MRKNALVIGTGVAIAAALVLGIVWLAFDSSSISVSAPPMADEPSGEPAMGIASENHGASREDARLEANAFNTPTGRAALAAHAERQRFEKALRDFLAGSETLPPAERARISAELDAQVEAEELAQRMSADEARMLRLALIERGSHDATERLRRSEALADAYRRESERRQRAFEQQQATDPAFVAYKAREAQIVAEVSAMRAIPGGISRDEYLRRRLQAERERAYAANPGG